MHKLAPLTLSAEQQDAVTSMAWEQSTGALVSSDLGTGKTAVAVETALTRGADQTLISAPLHTRWGWYDTVMRQTDYTAEFRWMNNTNKDGKRAFADFRAGVAGFYFIGRELARSQDWSKCAPDLVIHDECHSFANRSSASFKNAVKLAKVSGFTIAQSATWYGASFSGAWSIARVLWPDNHDVAPPSYHFWEGIWCATVYDNFAPGKKRVTGERNPGEFVKNLPLYVNIRSELTEPTDIPVYVDLTPKQRNLYRQMEKDSLAWLNENPLIADLPITQRIRLRQLTLAEAAIEDDEVIFPTDAKSSKLDALQGMLGDFGDERVLIVTDSAKFARLVAAKIGGFAWTGVATGEERDTAKVAFSTGDLKYIVATQSAIGEGVDGLQNNCHILVELSASDQVLMNQQTVGRLNRRGQAKQVLVYRVLARETLDDPQAETLLTRELAMRASMQKESLTSEASDR